MDLATGWSKFVDAEGGCHPDLSVSVDNLATLYQELRRRTHGRRLGRADDFDYEAFTDHGGSLKSVTLNNFWAIGSRGDGAHVGTLGPNVVIDGMRITGPYGGMDLSGSNNISPLLDLREGCFR